MFSVALKVKTGFFACLFIISLFDYCLAENTQKNTKKLIISAQNGDPVSQFNLANHYLGGTGGLPHNKEKAVDWYKKAANQGHADAQYRLGSFYTTGYGVERSNAEATKWFLKAGNQGHRDSQVLLGDYYYEGRYFVGPEYKYPTPDPPDYAEAMKWYKKASDQGNGHSSLRIAFLYKHGLGVPKNEAEEIRWYQKAADQGDRFARKILAEIPESKIKTLVQEDKKGTPDGHDRLALNTEGVSNHVLITKIFEGDFDNIYLDRSDSLFGILMKQYMESFGRKCSAALPPDKVEMTTERCVSEKVVRNGYGDEVSRSCVEWRTVGTGVFAKPAMHAALRTLYQQNAADSGRLISQAFAQAGRPGAISHMGRLLGDAKSVTNDMQRILSLNGCSSPALLRFEENLRRFAQNELPIPLNPEKATVSINNPPAGQSFKDQNYRKLIEDLILNDAQRWGAFAKFVSDSVNDARVVSRDSKGRPERVVAPYMWDSLMGRKRGQATLTFTDGIPKCLIYSETPNACHAANRQISAGYLRGDYSQ